MGFSGASVVKNPPAMQEMQVNFLGREDPLEKEMATHFSILAWEIPWTEEPGGLQSKGSQKSCTNVVTKQQPNMKKNTCTWYDLLNTTIITPI